MKLSKSSIFLSVLGIVIPLISFAQTAPNLIVSSDFVAFNYTQGDSTSNLNQQIMLFNQSSTDKINFQIWVPNQPSWLNTGYSTDILPINPGGTMGMGVSVDPTKVSAGTYSYDIGLHGDFANSPKNIHVTLNVSPYSAPTISYVQSPAEDKNILHPGERATVYGKNISTSYEVNFDQNGKIFYTSLTSIGSMGGTADFYVPQLLSGSYHLSLVPIGKGGESNEISVNVRNVSSSVPANNTNTTSGQGKVISPMTQSERNALIAQLQALLIQLIQQLTLVLQQENH